MDHQNKGTLMESFSNFVVDTLICIMVPSTTNQVSRKSMFQTSSSPFKRV